MSSNHVQQLLITPLLTPLSVLEPCAVDDDLQDEPKALVVVPYALRCFNYVPISPPSEATLTAEDDIPPGRYFNPDGDASSSSKCSTYSSDDDQDNFPGDGKDVFLNESEYASGKLRDIMCMSRRTNYKLRYGYET